MYKRSGFEAWFDLKFRSSFFLLGTPSIVTSQKFSKCRKNGIDRLRNGNLHRRASYLGRFTLWHNGRRATELGRFTLWHNGM